MLNCMGIENFFSIFDRQRFTFPLQNCQFLTNLNFENSFVFLFLLAKNHGKLIWSIDKHQVRDFWPKFGKT